MKNCVKLRKFNFFSGYSRSARILLNFEISKVEIFAAEKNSDFSDENSEED